MKKNLKRRELLSKTALGGVLLASSSMGNMVQAGKKKMKASPIVKSGLPETYLNQIASTALECLQTGRTCEIHCTREMSKGNAMMAKCQAKVQNMLSVCKSLADVTTYNSMSKNQLVTFAKFCKEICQDCADECNLHAHHHTECKNCLASCQKCIKACDKIIV